MKPVNWKAGPIALCLVLGVSGLLVYRQINAESSFTARISDVEAAKRTEVSAGGQDFRTELPDGNAVVGNGIVEPIERETRLAAAAGGVVKRVLVKEGDVVKKSALVVEMESDVELAAVLVAEGELAGAKARYDLSQRISTRTKNLGNSATADEADRTSKQVLIDEAAVKSASARLSQANAVLERLKIRSPIGGEVLQIRVRPGEFYSPSTTEPLLVVGDMSERQVRIDVDERDIGRIKLGTSAYVTADAFPKQKFAGRVVEIGRRMGRKNIRTDDPKERVDTKILEVLVALENAPKLVAGQRVVAYVEAGTTAKGSP